MLRRQVCEARIVDKSGNCVPILGVVDVDAADGRPRLCENTMARIPLPHLALAEERVELHLVYAGHHLVYAGHHLGLGNKGLQVVGLEIANADCPHAASAEQPLPALYAATVSPKSEGTGQCRR